MLYQTAGQTSSCLLLHLCVQTVRVESSSVPGLRSGSSTILDFQPLFHRVAPTPLPPFAPLSPQQSSRPGPAPGRRPAWRLRGGITWPHGSLQAEDGPQMCGTRSARRTCGAWRSAVELSRRESDCLEPTATQTWSVLRGDPHSQPPL